MARVEAPEAQEQEAQEQEARAPGAAAQVARGLVEALRVQAQVALALGSARGPARFLQARRQQVGWKEMGVLPKTTSRFARAESGCKQRLPPGRGGRQ